MVANKVVKQWGCLGEAGGVAKQLGEAFGRLV